MKTEETNKSETNRLIAEFMGVFDKILSTRNIYSWSDAPFFYTTEDSKEKVMENIAKYSKYHSDWNWLMEVVDKIYEMNLYYDRYIDYNSSMISDGKINLGTRINRVYEQVVEFIKWYNENSAKNN